MPGPWIYRALLRFYPRGWREQHGRELLDTLAGGGTSPRVREAAAVLTGAARTRGRLLLEPGISGRVALWREGVRVGALQIIFVLISILVVPTLAFYTEHLTWRPLVTALMFPLAFALGLRRRHILATAALLVALALALPEAWPLLRLDNPSASTALAVFVFEYLVPTVLLASAIRSPRRAPGSWMWLLALVATAAVWSGTLALRSASDHSERPWTYALCICLGAATLTALALSTRNPIPAIGLGVLQLFLGFALFLVTVGGGLDSDKVALLADWFGSAFLLLSAAMIRLVVRRPSRAT